MNSWQASKSKSSSTPMEHTTNKGEPGTGEQAHLPGNSQKKVQKIFTDLAVLEVTPEGLLLKEIYPGLTPEDIQSVTEPKLIIASDLKEIEL